MKDRPGCALVTGGSRGIGNAIARQLAVDGLHVVIIARDTQTLKSECESIIAHGGSASFVSVDFLLPNFLRIHISHLVQRKDRHLV